MELREELDPLPFLPEDIITARRRYPEAIKKLHNIGRIRAGMSESPAQMRENVFDFQSGLRLIMHLSWAPLNPPQERGPFLHISAKWVTPPNPKYLKMDKSPSEEVRKIVAYVTRRSPREAPFWGNISETGTLHMLFHISQTPEDFDEHGNRIEKENDEPV